MVWGGGTPSATAYACSIFIKSLFMYEFIYESNQVYRGFNYKVYLHALLNKYCSV